jgi:hypothetical protein
VIVGAGSLSALPYSVWLLGSSWILGILLCVLAYVTVVVVCTFHLMGILFVNKNLKYSTNAKKITHINLPYCGSATKALVTI